MMMTVVVLALALLALLLIGWALAHLARKNKAAPQAAMASAALPPEQVPVAQHYRHDKVGNDAAARPWDVAAPDEADFAPSDLEGTPATLPTSAETGCLTARPDQLPDRLPSHFDLALLLERSKDSFMRLHHAWEQADANALRDLLSPKIWQHVEQAMQAQALPEWGQPIGEVQHLAARALKAEEEEGRLRVQLEFTGSQVMARDGQTKSIYEVWDVAYSELPQLWQISDLQAKPA